MLQLALIASGMVTSVGLNAPACCAAIRCGIDNNRETPFLDQGGEWISGAMVPLEKPWRGVSRLQHMLVPAIRECLAAVAGVQHENIPLFLCVAEPERPGRISGLDTGFLARVEEDLEVRFHPQSALLAQGRIGPVRAIRQAAEMMERGQAACCLVAGVDSFLEAETLSVYEEKLRLLCSGNSNGFIPGEGAGAVLLGPAGSLREAGLIIRGLGFGHENAAIESEEPLRADGLVAAIRESLAVAGFRMEDLDFRITDANGEQYLFKEATLALSRILRQRREEFDFWHPADCLGEVGAATAPIVLGLAEAALRKGYAPGPGILCHFGNDDGGRAAVIVSSAV
ncbi:MAG: hypothetical protein AB1461_02015 [Thermodesulfobacteriota bacterium]